MRNAFAIAVLWIFGCALGAQTALSNDAIIKLIKVGLSDDLIVSTVNAAPGNYDGSADAIIALKSAGASDRLISIIVLKASSRATANPTTTPVIPPAAEPPAQEKLTQSFTSPSIHAPVRQDPTAEQTSNRPRVFLQSASKGTNRNAARDQSMEMSKDIEKDCLDVRVTVNPQMADYTIMLNHIEVGFARDNQIQVANKDGDLLSKTKEGGSIAGGMKKACALILEDWSKR